MRLSVLVFERLRALREEKGLALDSGADEVLWDFTHRILEARFGQRWQRPDKIEDELEELRRSIRALQRKIERMDPQAAFLARSKAIENEYPDTEERLRRMADEGWVDHAAVAALDRLEQALVYPIEGAIEPTRTQMLAGSAGRPPAWPARLVALRATEAYRALGGSSG